MITKQRLTVAVAIFFCVLFVCMLLPVSAVSGASDTDSAKIKVGCVEMNGFFEMDTNGNCSGFAYEMLREISMYTGHDFEFVKTSQSAGTEMLNSGKIDLFVPVEKTEESQKDYEFSSEAFASNTAVLLAKQDSHYCFNDFNSMNGITVGAVSDCQDNDRLVQYLQQQGCKVTLKRNYKSYSQLQEALRKGEIDALLTSSNRSLSNCRVIAQLPKTAIYAVTKRDNTRLMDSIDYALQQVNLNTPHFRDDLDLKYLSAGENVMPSYTKEEAQYIAKHSKLVVAVNGELQQENEIKSMETFTALLQQKTGLKIQLQKEKSVAAAYGSLNAGVADAILPINRDADWAQENGMWLTNSFFSMGNYRITKGGNASPNTLAIVKGTYQAYTSGKSSKHQILYCDSIEQAVDMVLKGKADETRCSRMEGDYFASQIKYGSLLSFTMDSGGVQPYAIGISKKNDSILISILNKAIGCMPSAQIEKIFNVKYAPQQMSPMDYFYQNPQILAVFCIAVLVLALLLMLLVASNAAVKRKNRQLESASRAKSDFLARMSHDLRTPMNAIVGLSHLGADECRESVIRDYFCKINSSSAYLLSLINDILDMSRIENKRVELHPEPVNVEEFIQSINTIMRPLLDKKNINFIVEHSGLEIPCMIFDRIHMQQILVNLLTNAVKFSRSGGRVKFTYDHCKREGEKIRTRITVRDYGIGMSDAFMRRIFTPFEQEHNNQMPEQTGTGLGLAIVKNLVDMMGGTVSVKSELEEGTEFTLELLLQEASLQKKTGSVISATEQYALAGVRVLLVEDHPLNTEIACKLLQKQGVQTECAENGEIAVQMFEDSQPHYYHAVLMDIRMPVMNGLEAAKAIRALNRVDAGTVPIIAMSANAFDEDVRESLQAGMNAHLAKPIVPAQMYKELERWVSGSANR